MLNKKYVMVNNQNEFNEKFPKEEKKIELKYKKFKEQQLIIEDYQELENLCLQNVKSIDKIILKNLTKLQECTI